MKTFFQIIGLLLCFFLSACAKHNSQQIPVTTENVEDDFLDDSEYYEEKDDKNERSFESSKIEKATFNINHQIYKWMIDPASKPFVLIPESEKCSAENFFNNLLGLSRILNGTLQGDWFYATTEFGEFLINSLFSGGVCKIVNKNPSDERNFGDTLLKWGVPKGDPLIFPVVGAMYPAEFAGIILEGYFLGTFVFPDSSFVAIKAGNKLSRWEDEYSVYLHIYRNSLDPITAFKKAYADHQKFN